MEYFQRTEVPIIKSKSLRKYISKTIFEKQLFTNQFKPVFCYKRITNSEIKAKQEYENILLKKKEILINSIIELRKKAAKCFMHNVSLLIHQRKVKEILIIKHILERREKAALLLQSNFRRYLVEKDLKDILSPRNPQIFFYTLPKLNQCISPENSVVELKLRNKKTFSFKFSKCLNKYYIPMKRTGKKEFKVSFIINSNNIIDSRFPVELNVKTGNFYNVIYSNLMYIKPKISSSQKQKKPKISEWERIFQINRHKRKLSLDNLSTTLSQKTDISEELNIIHNNSNVDNFFVNYNCKNKPKKSILKKNNVNQSSSKKKVTFCTRCEYFIL